MATSAEPQPRARSWWPLAVAVGLFLFLPVLPPLRTLFPAEQTAQVLLPMIAVCAIVGWLSGGQRLLLAMVWVALAVWYLSVPGGPPGSPYVNMARGWILLLAGSFGLVSVWNPASTFFVRGLGALGLAVGTGFFLAVASPGGLARYEHVAASEFARRTNESISDVRVLTQTKDWRDMMSRAPSLDGFPDVFEQELRSISSASTILFPALIALESLAAMGLAWALYTRMGGGAAGLALEPLREFRFNDQLVWGVAVGLTLLLLPPFAEGRNAGWNLLVFFGALYLVRGMAVLAWMSRRRTLLVATVLIVLFIPPLLPVLVFATLGIGLGDTWLDWRTRAIRR